MCVMQRTKQLTYVNRMELICISVGLNPTALGIKHGRRVGKADIRSQELNVTPL